MNAVRTNVALRTAASIVAFFAWLVLSNHCAVATLFPVKSPTAAAAGPACCKNQTKPADGDAPCPQMPQGCCKTLKVAMPDGAKIPHEQAVGTLPVIAGWLVAFTLTQPEAGIAATGDGLPPDSPTFAELVLHRSLRSHAPPVPA